MSLKMSPETSSETARVDVFCRQKSSPAVSGDTGDISGSEQCVGSGKVRVTAHAAALFDHAHFPTSNPHEMHFRFRMSDYNISNGTITEHPYPECFYKFVIDFWLVIETILFYLATLVGLGTNLVFLVTVTRTTLIHPNVRFLLGNLCVASLINILYQFFYAVYNTVVIFYQEASIFASRPLACALAQAPFLISGICIILSIAWICVERALATFFDWTTEDQKSTVTFRLIVAGSWVVALSAVIICILCFPLQYRQYICYCHAVLAVPKQVVRGLVGICISIDILALVLCFLVLMWNRHQLNSFGINLATRHSLAQRFQLSNNVETTSSLFPIVILHSLSLTTTFALWAYLQGPLHQHASVANLDLLLASHFPELMFSIVYPLICISQHRHLNRYCYEHFPKVASHVAGPRKLPVRRSTKAVGRNRSMTVPEVSPLNPGIVSFHAGPDDAQMIIDQFWQSTSG